MKPIIYVATCTSLLFSNVTNDFYKPIIQPKSIIKQLEKKDANILFGMNAGSLGGGFDISLKLSKHLQTRYNYNSLSFSKKGMMVKDIEKLPYFARANLSTQGFIIDYFPFENFSLHLSTGIYGDKNRMNSKVIYKNKPMKLGDKEYTFDLVQRVDTKVDFKKEVPYFGLGFGGKITKKGLGWSLDAGILYHGKPKVHMTPVYGVDSKNTVNIKKAIDESVKDEEEILYNKIKKYKYYPVIKFGLNYSF